MSPYEFFLWKFLKRKLAVRLKSKPLTLNHKTYLFTKETAATFNFMQQRINHVLTYQNKLLSMTCHDIRTPLARIQGRLLKEKDNEDQKDLKYITDINAMLDDLVLFSKENWLHGIEFECTNITDFFDECADEYIELEKHVRIINKMPDDIDLELTRPAFKHAINNIINNGLKHGTKVTITLTLTDKIMSKNHRELQVYIDDNGTGIP